MKPLGVRNARPGDRLADLVTIAMPG
jgi:hypothetical protein